MTIARIVQLPFPSTHSPDHALQEYYRHYSARYEKVFPQYFVPEGDLWEMPIWVAHITALLDAAGLDSSMIDLSRSQIDPSVLAEEICDASYPHDLILVSPLAQNLDLSDQVSAILNSRDRRVIIGGNMAPLADSTKYDDVVVGQLTVDRARRLAGRLPAEEVAVSIGRQESAIAWAPSYRHLGEYSNRVPVIRINASHGCLYQCGFCGDAWSRQLTLVDRAALRTEVAELHERFPDTRVVYVGDKTFGQSKEAVSNLIDAFRGLEGYRFVVQTHVMALKPWVVEAMCELGVDVVEMGFESGDTELLRATDKLSRGLDDYARQIESVSDAGMHVVLNVLGGLDDETHGSHNLTVDWMRDTEGLVWLYNLYNFVPYPLVPSFSEIRDRIVDWNFGNWREDAPLVYTPRKLSIEESWGLFQDKISVAQSVISKESYSAQRPADTEFRRSR